MNSEPHTHVLVIDDPRGSGRMDTRLKYGDQSGYVNNNWIFYRWRLRRRARKLVLRHQKMSTMSVKKSFPDLGPAIADIERRWLDTASDSR